MKIKALKTQLERKDEEKRAMERARELDEFSRKGA